MMCFGSGNSPFALPCEVSKCDPCLEPHACLCCFILHFRSRRHQHWRQRNPCLGLPACICCCIFYLRQGHDTCSIKFHVAFPTDRCALGIFGSLSVVDIEMSNRSSGLDEATTTVDDMYKLEQTMLRDPLYCHPSRFSVEFGGSGLVLPPPWMDSWSGGRKFRQAAADPIVQLVPRLAPAPALNSLASYANRILADTASETKCRLHYCAGQRVRTHQCSLSVSYWANYAVFHSHHISLETNLTSLL